MKKFLILFFLIIACSAVNAEFYSMNNPFPEQTCPEKYNNIYESEPAYMQREGKASKKKSIKIKTEDTQKKDEIEKFPAYKFDGSQEQNFMVFPVK